MIEFDKWTDDKLIEILREPHKKYSEKAFYTLYKRYERQLFSFCMFKADNKDLAEEFFQETWVRFDKKIKQNNNIKSVIAYLITIAKNIIIDYYRKKDNLLIDKNVIIEDLEIAEPYSDWQNDFDFNDLNCKLNLAISELSEIYQDAFIMNKINGLSYEEIAEITGESKECIRKRVVRAVLKIRYILKPYLINEEL